MTRWLQAAKSAQRVPDTNDNNDFIQCEPALNRRENGETVFLSFKSFLSGGGKADFGNADGAQSSPSQHDPEALQMEFEERAAFLEYDGGFSRVEAEGMAQAEIYGANIEKGGAE